MSLVQFFDTPAQTEEKRNLPLLRALIARYADERPFAGAQVAFGHILVRNSMVVAEALVRGGAELVLSNAHRSPASAPVEAELAAAGMRVLPVAEAAERLICSWMSTPCSAASIRRGVRRK